jgi:hypothetical protein
MTPHRLSEFSCRIFTRVTIWVQKAEESPMLEAVARERLLKTQQAGKRLSRCCYVI